jgi:hypothetical protein
VLPAGAVPLAIPVVVLFGAVLVVLLAALLPVPVDGFVA